MTPNQVLIQNTGVLTATPATPNAVADGTIAAFNAITGANAALGSAAPDEFYLVRGTPAGVTNILTPILKKSDIAKVYKQTYVAPVKSAFSIASIPVGPTGGGIYTIRVIDTQKGREPFDRETFPEPVVASQTLASIITQFVTAMNARNSFFTAKSNKIQTITLTGASGTANVTVTNLDGTTSVYLATFNSTLTQTATDFVAAYASTILATAGITLTSSGADLIFTDAAAGDFTNVAIANVSGDLDGTSAATQAATLLILTANTINEIMALAIDDDLAGTTATATKTLRVEGSGSGAQILDAEKRAVGATSRYYQENTVLGSLDSVPTYSSPTGQYLMYTINYKNDIDDNINRPFKYQEVLIALEDAVTGDLDTFFTGLI